MPNLVFLCHGNICRSVAAEWIAKKMIAERGLVGFAVISRAVSYEESGNDIYYPMKQALSRAGIPYGHHEARRIDNEDYRWADHIYYMDEMNLRLCRRFIVDKDDKFTPIYSFVPGLSEIEDPWYSGRYDLVVSQISQCLEKIFIELTENQK